MPELPEVETVRQDLSRVLVGQKLSGMEVGRPRSLRHPDPSTAARWIEGGTVLGVGRVGKHLLIEVDRPTGDTDGRSLVVIHLGMSGQLWWLPSSTAAHRHAHVRIFGESANELRFVDPRTFGWVAVARAAEVATVLPVLERLGPDPLSGDFDATVLSRRIGHRQGRLKALLMDQTVVSGLGNIYSDEVLHAAGLRWDRPACSLDPREIVALHDQIVRVLSDAVSCRGSSLADSQYRDLYGLPGRFQERHRVYARAGKPCARCGETIRKERFGGRSTFFCPSCQT
ncbi:MAG: bifunctional DNA-formamidopyrimidine glycosylase/DNA-(apurinic or apyrimidinic site) lyase [Actinomycetota bacterium]|nr:bifunctional DNA-formamidopyrimidine glycosylase/DNA-(apurinic or apyrimidinic site) lyase [Actinomycetota bacterium]